MKKTILFLLAVLFTASTFAQKAPTAKLISSSEERIVVQVDLNGFTTNKVQTPQGEQFVISAPKMASMLEAGAPDLPMFPVPAIIGDMAEMTVSVINAQYTDYANMSIAPSKGNISRQVNPDDVPYTYGPMYQQNAFWPDAQAILGAPYILRDFRGQNIMVRPFAYNPATKTLRVYESLTVEMTKVSNNGENQKTTRRSNTIKVDPEQKAQYSHRFINFGETESRYIFDEDAGELLIICTDTYMSNLEPLVAWKNKSGRPTTMVSLTTAGGNNIENIKNYVSSFYNDPNHNLEYLLLVGEYNDLTPKNYGYGSGGTVYSDNYLGKLEGSDDYLEVLVGRLSVSNGADADLQVGKIIYFERDIQEEATWADKGMGIGYYGAGSGHYGEDDYQHIDLIRDTLLHYTYSTITEHHGGSGGDASVSTISGTVNQGIGIINYCNHGSETTWGVANYSTSNVAALTNDYKLPIVWSVACLNGKFDVGTCFGESWLRANNNATGAPTGAVGGMFSFVSQPWVPPMYGQDEMVDILTEWRSVDQFNHTFGGASLNGSMYVLDMAPGDSYQTFNAWLLFGDPSMMLRTAIPATMNVTTSPSVLMIGMSELQITADVDFAIATLSLDGEIIASGEIVNGEGTLTFPAISNVGTADLVILGYNKVTYMGTIDLVPAEGAYITMDNYAMNVDQANYGETINMNIGVKNVGVETANNITATLTTSSEYVEILVGENTIASIDPDEIVTLEGFQFSVAEDVPDKTKAYFTLEMTNGTDTWSSNITIELHAPILSLESITQHQGDDFNITFTLKNNGSAPFYGGTLNVFSSSTSVIFETTSFVFDDVVAGDETVDVVVPYSIDPATPQGSTFAIAYEVISGLQTLSGDYTLTYGAIMEGFESGQFNDNWSFSTQYPWTIVSEGAHEGTYCAKSNNNGAHSSEGYMILTVDVPAAGDMTFYYKVSSEQNYDKLFFYMDNQQKGVWSGSIDWTLFTQPVTPGSHTFKWSYTKDTSVSSGSDCAWVDDIVFPPVNVVTFLEPVTNLNAVVDDRDVTLSWTGSNNVESYIISRNGEEIDRVTDTIFNDFVEYGTYEYTVVAATADGLLSAPTTITVEVVDLYSVGENTLSIDIYPNPANSTLNINGHNTEYSYFLYNNMGQEMIKGTAHGTHQINVSSMPKGIYFLRLTSGSQVSIQKIIVE